METCECQNWARAYPSSLLTNHHMECPKYDPEGDARKIIDGLLDGIIIWAADEDGVHYKVWDAYQKARMAVGRPPTPGPMSEKHARHIAACLDACRWRPTIDTAPKDGSQFLVIEDEETVSLGHWDKRKKKFVDANRKDLLFPSYWRPVGPLPAMSPPTG